MSNDGAGAFPAQLAELRARLAAHPLHRAIGDVAALRLFMTHHVYAVWDFMSLLKALQRHLAPVTVPWLPPRDARHANVINRLVLEEESDRAIGASGHASHFESYCRAMEEVGADTRPLHRFLSAVAAQGLDQALASDAVPLPARRFMRFTFRIIARNQPHELAAALAWGREDLVPQLFSALQTHGGICQDTAPLLQGYLARHIELDGQDHGPMILEMARDLCEGSVARAGEAMAVAQAALLSRIEFWDAIYAALPVAPASAPGGLIKQGAM